MVKLLAIYPNNDVDFISPDTKQIKFYDNRNREKAVRFMIRFIHVEQSCGQLLLTTLKLVCSGSAAQ